MAGTWRAGWDTARRSAPQSGPVAAGVVLGLLAGVTVLRWFVDGAGQAAALLYVVPIALAALRFGRRGGAATAAFAVAAFVVLASVHARGDLDATGWIGPLLAMALVGGLVGHLSELAEGHQADRGVQAQRARQLQELCDAQRTAIEASDSMVQRVAAARWLLEAGHTDEALATLDDTVADGVGTVSPAMRLGDRSPEGGGAGAP